MRHSFWFTLCPAYPATRRESGVKSYATLSTLTRKDGHNIFAGTCPHPTRHWWRWGRSLWTSPPITHSVSSITTRPPGIYILCNKTIYGFTGRWRLKILSPTKLISKSQWTSLLDEFKYILKYIEFVKIDENSSGDKLLVNEAEKCVAGKCEAGKCVYFTSWEKIRTKVCDSQNTRFVCQMEEESKT